MSIKDLQNINWEAVTLDDLAKAHDLKDIDFEINNGRITRVFLPGEDLD